MHRRGGEYEQIDESLSYLRNCAATLATLEMNDGLSHVLFGLAHGIEEASRHVIQSTVAPADLVGFSDAVRSDLRSMGNKIGVVQNAMAVEANERENLRDYMAEMANMMSQHASSSSHEGGDLRAALDGLSSLAAQVESIGERISALDVGAHYKNIWQILLDQFGRLEAVQSGGDETVKVVTGLRDSQLAANVMFEHEVQLLNDRLTDVQARGENVENVVYATKHGLSLMASALVNVGGVDSQRMR